MKSYQLALQNLPEHYITKSFSTFAEIQEIAYAVEEKRSCPKILHLTNLTSNIKETVWCALPFHCQACSNSIPSILWQNDKHRKRGGHFYCYEKGHKQFIKFSPRQCYEKHYHTSRGKK